MPESKRHFEARTALYQMLMLAFSDRMAIGSDQFVYWDPTNPRQCLAPDVFARVGVPDEPFGSWKVWERGAPDVAVEIVSTSDQGEPIWEEKLERYRRLGIRELVRFDPDVVPPSLRVWDCVEGDLVERESSGLTAPSRFLPGHWAVVPDARFGHALRLSRDAGGLDLFPTPAEHEKQAAERERAERVAAEARVRELEAELARRAVKAP